MGAGTVQVVSAVREQGAAASAQVRVLANVAIRLHSQRRVVGSHAVRPVLLQLALPQRIVVRKSLPTAEGKGKAVRSEKGVQTGKLLQHGFDGGRVVLFAGVFEGAFEGVGLAADIF